MKTMHRILFADSLFWASRPFLKLFDIQVEDARVTRRGIRWRLDLRESIDLSLFFTGTFEPDVTVSYQRFLRPGDHVLDVGANFGAHTLRFAKAVGSAGKVRAFEPTRYALDRLKANLELNPELGAVTDVEFSFLNPTAESAVPESVSSSFRLASFSGSEKRSEKDFGFAKSTAGASSTSLDRFCAGFQSLDFIKMDVDGNEPEVIGGAGETLKRLRPVLLVEVAPGHFVDTPKRFHDWVQSILNAGYRVFDLKFQPMPTTSQALWDRTPIGAYSNLWMVPEEKVPAFLDRVKGGTR